MHRQVGHDAHDEQETRTVERGLPVASLGCASSFPTATLIEISVVM